MPSSSTQSPLKRFSTLLRGKKDKDKRKSVLPTGDEKNAKKGETNKVPNRSEGKKVVVIAGASVGLGHELVKRFVSKGFSLETRECS